MRTVSEEIVATLVVLPDKRDAVLSVAQMRSGARNPCGVRETSLHDGFAFAIYALISSTIVTIY